MFELKAGTLYPLLHGLEGKGCLRYMSRNMLSKTRKYYSITKREEHYWKQRSGEWSEYQSAVQPMFYFAMGVKIWGKIFGKTVITNSFVKTEDPYIAEEIRGTY